MKFQTSTLWIVLLAVSVFACKKTLVEDIAPPPPPGQDANLIVESYPAVQTGVNVSVDAEIDGFYAAVPALYQYTTKRYALILSIHDVNAMGNGTSDLPKVLTRGIPRLLSENKFPPSFSVGGKAHAFIVVSPQFNTKPTAKNVNNMIDYAVKHYRIDSSRIYVVGHSSGGGAAWDYSVIYGSRIAGVVPISGTNSFVNDTRGGKIATTNLPVWAFHNDDDPTVPVAVTSDFVNLINNHLPTPISKETIFASTSHDAWTKATDPKLKIDGKNIYEWMLQYNR